MTVCGDLKGCARTEEQRRAPEGGHRAGPVKFNLRNFGVGGGAVLFLDLPVGAPKVGEDSDEQANDGGDAVEGTECQDGRLRPKEPVFAMTQGYTCSQSVVHFPRMLPRL